MRVRTRENGAIVVGVVVAIAAFVLLASFTGISPWLLYAVVFAVGVLLPLALTHAAE